MKIKSCSWQFSRWPQWAPGVGVGGGGGNRFWEGAHVKIMISSTSSKCKWTPWVPAGGSPRAKNHAKFKGTSSPDPEVQQASYVVFRYLLMRRIKVVYGSSKDSPNGAVGYRRTGPVSWPQWGLRSVARISNGFARKWLFEKL